MTREQYDERIGRFHDLVRSLVKSYNGSVEKHNFDEAMALMKEIKLNIAEHNDFQRDVVYGWLVEQDAPMQKAIEVVSYEVMRLRRRTDFPWVIEVVFPRKGIDLHELKKSVLNKAAERCRAECTEATQRLERFRTQGRCC